MKRAVMTAIGVSTLLGACAMPGQTPPATAQITAGTQTAGNTAVNASAAPLVSNQLPAPLPETKPAPPAPGHNWVPGHWVWANEQWSWWQGRYVQGAVQPMPALQKEENTLPPSPAHARVRGHWVWGGKNWVWNPGRWVLAAR
jgi:hypothetical protein